MGSHGVTCHPTQMNTPRLTRAMQAGTRFTYLGGMDGWIDIVDLIALRPAVELATFRSRVRRPTTAPPRPLFFLCRGVGVARQVEGKMWVNEEGNVVLTVTETTGVIVDHEEGRAAAVQTSVREVVLGNVLSNEQQSIQDSSTPLIGRSSLQDDDEGCSCWCVIKWTLLVILSLICLPFLPLILLCICCLRIIEKTDDWDTSGQYIVWLIKTRLRFHR